MEHEKMMAVFSELLENQKEIVRSQRDVISVLQELKVQLEEVTNKIANQKPDAPNDMKIVRQAIESGIAEIKLFISMQLQKQGSNNWRIFLESDAKKLAVYLVVSLTFLTYLYCFPARLD